MNANTTILVGVSGSPASLAALRWAHEEASSRQCRLRVVLIWHRELRASYTQRADRGESEEQPSQAWRVLIEAMRRALGSGPWPATTVEAIEGETERVLVAASDDADLLVLGSGSAEVIGPVVRTCLTEAHCPVVVVSQAARPTKTSQTVASSVTQRAAVAVSR